MHLFFFAARHPIPASVPPVLRAFPLHCTLIRTLHDGRTPNYPVDDGFIVQALKPAMNLDEQIVRRDTAFYPVGIIERIMHCFRFCIVEGVIILGKSRGQDHVQSGIPVLYR